MGIRIAEHIPLPNNAAHASELDAHCLKSANTTFFESFFAGCDFVANFIGCFFAESGIFPMAVSEQNAWDFALYIFRFVEIACDKETGAAFEIDFFDGVIGAIYFAMNYSFKGCPSGHGPKAL